MKKLWIAAVVVGSLLMISCSGMMSRAETVLGHLFGGDHVEWPTDEAPCEAVTTVEPVVEAAVEPVVEAAVEVVETESNTGATRVEANSDLEQMAVYYANEAAAAMQSGNEVKVEQISKKVEDYYMNLSYENQQKFDTLFEATFQARMSAVVEAAGDSYTF